MKTTSQISSAFMYAMFIIASVAALSGATHQWFLAAISLGVALCMHRDSRKKTESVNPEEDI